MKYIVDSLNGDLIMFVLVVFISFIVVYGILCLLNVLFGEVCDMLFGWVIECVMCCFGLKVFKYLYNLDLGFYLNWCIGGLLWDIECGINGVSFFMCFMVFNIVFILLEIIFVVGLFLF